MSNPYIGEIRLVPFTFAPQDWAFCDGQLLPISEYDALFNLIGTTYGGDGQTTFALPNLQSRAPVGMGQGPGLSNYVIGQSAGAENVTVTPAQMPPHSHAAGVVDGSAATSSPAAALPANAPLGLGNVYAPPGSAVQMAASAIGSAGSGQAHPNIQPYLALNFIISLFGIFPSPN